MRNAMFQNSGYSLLLILLFYLYGVDSAVIYQVLVIVLRRRGEHYRHQTTWSITLNHMYRIHRDTTHTFRGLCKHTSLVSFAKHSTERHWDVGQTAFSNVPQTSILISNLLAIHNGDFMTEMVTYVTLASIRIGMTNLGVERRE